MLMGDLRHDFVRTFVDRFPDLRWDKLNALIAEMTGKGDRTLAGENIAPERRQHAVTLDCRYLKQYHEVSFAGAARRDRKPRCGRHPAGLSR